jgi:CheY-like chemotaxis protein
MISQPTVLYVEDDANSRDVMRMMLKMSMRLPIVTFFENSQNFLDRLLALTPRPDIIFLDIHLKPISGFEMLRIIREQPIFGHVPVVALTASVMNEEIHRLRNAGFDGCISKPIDIETFPEHMQRILNGETVWRIM